MVRFTVLPWRPLAVFAGLLLLWGGGVALFQPAPYLLPSPLAVGRALVTQADVLAGHAALTLLEIILGLVLGVMAGGLAAMVLAAAPRLRRWLLPVLVASQAIPVFALAPLLVLWLGYGLASKVAMAVLIVFFPVAAAFHDGLRQTEPGWLDVARIARATPLATLRFIRLPAALPACASGLRIAAAVAPIGAVVGEWVGASAGLGYLMLYANARVQTDLMFAALFILCALGVALYFGMDAALRRALPWLADDLRLVKE